MSAGIIGLLTGLLIGGTVGFVTAACCFIAGKGARYEETSAG